MLDRPRSGSISGQASHDSFVVPLLTDQRRHGRPCIHRAVVRRHFTACLLMLNRRVFAASTLAGAAVLYGYRSLQGDVRSAQSLSLPLRGGVSLAGGEFGVDNGAFAMCARHVRTGLRVSERGDVAYFAAQGLGLLRTPVSLGTTATPIGQPLQPTELHAPPSGDVGGRTRCCCHPGHAQLWPISAVIIRQAAHCHHRRTSRKAGPVPRDISRMRGGASLGFAGVPTP